MKKIFLFKGTISGKSALFRYCLIIVISAFGLEFLFGDEYSIPYLIREQKFLEICFYLCFNVPLFIVEFTTTYKRLSSFKNSKNWFGSYLSNYAGELVGLFVMISIALELELSMRGFGGDQLAIIYLFFFTLFALIPSLINSPIIDSKQHEG
jgi:hypothetical protein